jgi:hypothetical protein
VLYTEERLAALARLPWFQEGVMPNWIRRALIAEMPSSRTASVRLAIARLLYEARERDSGDEGEDVRFRIAEDRPTEALAPEELFDDDVLLDFMARGAIEDLELHRKDLSGRKDRQVLVKLDDIIAVALALTYAGAAFALTPKPNGDALLTGAWVPLGTLVLGASLALAFAFPRRTYEVVRAALERTAPLALLFVFPFAILTLAPTFVENLDAQADAGLLTFLGAAAITVAAHPFVYRVTHRFGVLVNQSKRLIGRLAQTAAESALVLLLAKAMWTITHAREVCGACGTPW